MPATPLPDPHPAASGLTSPAAAMWDSRYQGAEYLFGTEPNRCLQRHAALWPAGSRVLCVADGEGRNSVWLARQGLQVDAFDISAVAIGKAQQLADAHGVSVQYTQADSDHWHWPSGVYDGVVAVFVQFADPAMRQRLFDKMLGALKPGGTLLLHGYTPQQLALGTGGPSELSHLYTEAMLTEAFASMELVSLRAYEETLSEGSRHQGRSALIDLIARKSAPAV